MRITNMDTATQNTYGQTSMQLYKHKLNYTGQKRWQRKQGDKVLNLEGLLIRVEKKQACQKQQDLNCVFTIAYRP